MVILGRDGMRKIEWDENGQKSYKSVVVVFGKQGSSDRNGMRNEEACCELRGYCSCVRSNV